MPDLKITARKELGDSGVYFTDFGSPVDNEYNYDFQGFNKFKIIEQMRRGDATVRAALLAIKLPILTAKWYIEPGGNSEKDIKIAKFVEDALFNNPKRSWFEFIRETLNYLDYGFYVWEIVYEDVIFDGKKYISIRKLAPRLPNTIVAWKTEDGEDGVIQWTLSKGQVSIPIWKLLIFTNEKEGDNWEGISILRYAYKHWYYKEQLYKIDAIGLERQGVGVPYAKLPIGAATKTKEEVKEILQNIRANENAYVLVPEDVEVGFLNMGSGSVRDPYKSILHHDRQIVKSVLAQFLELGATSTGSYALSEDQRDLFMLSLEAVANYVQSVIQKYLIERLVDFNFEVAEYPKLRYTKIAKVDVDKFMSAIHKAVQSGVLTPDSEIENIVRKHLDLPELNDNTIRIKEKGKEENKADEFVKEKKGFFSFLKEFRDNLKGLITGKEKL